MKRRLLLTAVLVTVALLSGAPAEIAPETDLLIPNLNYSASPHLKIQDMKALSMPHEPNPAERKMTMKRIAGGCFPIDDDPSRRGLGASDHAG